MSDGFLYTTVPVSVHFIAMSVDFGCSIFSTSRANWLIAPEEECQYHDCDLSPLMISSNGKRVSTSLLSAQCSVLSTQSPGRHSHCRRTNCVRGGDNSMTAQGRG